MKMRWLSIALLFGLLLGAVAAPVAAGSRTSGLAVPVSGSATNSQGGVSAFKGTLTITSFDKQGSSLVVNGVLDGTLSDSSSTVIGNIRRFGVSAPENTIRASCDRLDMELYKIEIVSSGFNVKLDPVVVAISIKDYPNTKLDKLLCNLSKKLEKNSPAAAIASNLNQILREIGG
ncbi:MAG: hypothetical protein U0X20_05835 [Caldilineaceae bacterium]